MVLFNPMYLIDIAALVLIAVIIAAIEKKLKKSVLKRISRNASYQRKIKSIEKEKDPQIIIDSLNLLARKFFREAFGLDSSLEYSELIEQLSIMKKEDCTKLSESIQNALYSGEKLSKKQLLPVFSLFRKVINANPISRV